MKVTTKTLLALLVLTVAGLPAMAQDLPKIVFGSDCTFPPLEFLDTNKQIVGFDIDLIDAAAKAAASRPSSRTPPGTASSPASRRATTTPSSPRSPSPTSARR